MKTMIERLLIAVALLTAVTHAMGYGHQGENANGQKRKESKVTGNEKGKYAEVNGLKMYYEIHGTGKPLLLLHGAFSTVEGWATILPALTKNRQVILVELEGHGHTRDLDRPLTFEQMADDTALLLKQLKLTRVEIFGYSMGGTVALGVAIRHPELVSKLAIYGSCAGTAKDTYDPETYKQFQSLSTDFAPPILKEPYDRTAPDPTRWPILVTKIKKLEDDFKGYSPAELKAIKAQTLIMMGDRDAVRPEHAVEMYRLIPNAQLAIFPGGDHFMLWITPDKIVSTLTAFLNNPMPQTGQPPK